VEKTVGLALSLIVIIGTLLLIFKLLPAFILVLHGDYVNATDVVINVSVEEVISQVYWAVVVAIVSPIVGFFVYLFRK